MPLDSSIQTLFQRMPHLQSFSLWDKTPAEAREDYKWFCQFADPKETPIGKTEDIEGEGPLGPIAMRVYTPVASGGVALPAIIYFHGGGFVLGDLECYEGLCRALANEAGCRVISVNYRLAPEFPFPAAVEDAVAAASWVEAHAPDLGVDPNRLAVAGNGAGGNLAAVTAILAKDRKNTPAIAFQLLIYPTTRFGPTLSEHPFGSGYLLDSRTTDRFREYYVPPGTDLTDPRLSPLDAKDLAGLPPAYIVTAGFDRFRDDGSAYAGRLKSAGVRVMQVDYPTMIHGFFSMPGVIPLASEAIRAAAHAARDALK